MTSGKNDYGLRLVLQITLFSEAIRRVVNERRLHGNNFVRRTRNF